MKNQQKQNGRYAVTMRKMIKPLAMAALLFGVGPAYAANEYTEVEPNSPIANAMLVTPGSDGVIKITGNLDHDYAIASQDTDFFKFHGVEGSNIIVTVTQDQNVLDVLNPILAIFEFKPNPNDPNGRYNYHLMAEDSFSGSSATINIASLPHDGDYWVAVTSGYMTFGELGEWGAVQPNSIGYYPDPVSGNYHLNLAIAGLTPPADSTPPVDDTPPANGGETTKVYAEVKPLGGENAAWNVKSKGVIPVGIYSTKGFDATQIDPASLSFGKQGNENNAAKCEKEGRDLDGDGDPDLVCFFWIDKANFEEGDRKGWLKGKKGGVDFASENVDLKRPLKNKGANNKASKK